MTLQTILYIVGIVAMMAGVWCIWLGMPKGKNRDRPFRD